MFGLTQEAGEYLHQNLLHHDAREGTRILNPIDFFDGPFVFCLLNQLLPHKNLRHVRIRSIDVSRRLGAGMPWNGLHLVEGGSQVDQLLGVSLIEKKTDAALQHRYQDPADIELH